MTDKRPEDKYTSLQFKAEAALNKAPQAEIWIEYRAASKPETIIDLIEENRALREALTPSAETKAAYISEVVFETISDDDEDGLPVPVKRYVHWTAIKELMTLIRKRAEASQ